MAARNVQISIDEDLLGEMDRRPETRARGRSAVIRRAIRLYLALDRRREIDAAYARGYGGGRTEVLDEFADLAEGQSWPDW
jgi:metal-responsive CopG/Arc/MetJ family transcriptional regulator